MHTVHGKTLGKHAPRHDKRTLQLVKYLHASLPPAPPAVKWSKSVSAWPMNLNDKIGDCAIASASHMIQAWQANAMAKDVEIGDAAVLKGYEAFGYRPGDPGTDQGCVELDVLKYWRKHGFGGHKIAAFASVSPQNVEALKDAIQIFGGAYVGFSLPVSAQDQAVWDVPAGGLHGHGAPGSWGGHAVPILDYDTRGLTCITWGATQRMSWAFLNAYCDEAYAILTDDFLKSGKAPNHLDVTALKTDLGLLG